MASESVPSVTVEGKTAVVVGGTRGIGRAIALGFAEDGADVVATSRSADAVERVAEELRERGAATAEVRCDVTDADSLETLRDTVTEDVGDVDILVNSAGTVAQSPVTEMTDEEWQRDIDVDLTGVFKTCQVFAREMESGSIVNISSMSADQAREARAAYCAAKSGVNGLTRALSADLAPDVRVNAIAPGFVKTEMAGPKLEDGSEFRATVDERTPMGRVAAPEEMVGAALYLASDAASFTTGEVITVDGGYDDSAQ
ncbi:MULTISPECIES: SDR family NAD(P)-dependent oxidoreductase [Halobacterium]|uniref:SDR family NAD(P)-dependent oxidoreductase n=1 Tax=Halobacterium TaxID=2239 RepID=UPI00073EEA06|nr:MULTISPECIES: SDR family oxidoreductase [Halobacterium]MCG1003179.1 SDR family oxidoreductase [Halobacterium noricense]